MSATRRHPVILVNESALHSRLVRDLDPEACSMIVAGNQIVDMTLAELALPGAQMIWTDFQQSRSLGQLHQKIDVLGGLDHLVLAADGKRAETTFSVMCAILCLLPALRRSGRGRISLILDDGPAVAGLQEFLTRLAPRLLRQSITIGLEVTQVPEPAV